MKTIYKKRIAALGLVLLISCFSACKKMVEADLPLDKGTAQSVYNNISSSVAVMNGIYLNMGFGGGPFEGDGGLSVVHAFAADELTLMDPFSGDAIAYKNGLDYLLFWDNLYQNYLFPVNSLIDGVSTSKNISDDNKKILLGEAKFLRALIYFYLVNDYGDVPLALTTDIKVNSHLARSPVSKVYEQIIQDLTDAQAGLSTNFLSVDLITTSSERVRPNRAAATALLARVYLYLGQWQKAEAMATLVINDSNYSLQADLDGVFLKNSREAIWQLQPNVPNWSNTPNTLDGLYFIPNIYDLEPKATISDDLWNAFEAGDLRKTHWITAFNNGQDNFNIPFKYKAGPAETAPKEYTMVLRLAEQYIIRAEARAHLNKVNGAGSAEEDLNVIRGRAGLPPTTANSLATMLDAIQRERRVELFTEWGHRWFDLKRTGNLDAVMSVAAPLKGGTWAPFKALFPIPNFQFRLNPNLKPQNPGYPEPN